MNHDDIQILIRMRAYEIWESEGYPEGKADDHWLQAEAEMQDQTNAQPQSGFDSESSDEEGIRAARQYEQGLKQFEASGQSDAKAKEAEQALDGPEAATLKKAEQIGKKRGRGEDLAGNR
jgi:hypothetical protein